MRRSPLIVSIIQTLRKASMASSQDSVRRQELLRLLVEPLLAANVSRMRSASMSSKPRHSMIDP